jgi:hypothetical protein
MLQRGRGSVLSRTREAHFIKSPAWVVSLKQWHGFMVALSQSSGSRHRARRLFRSPFVVVVVVVVVIVVNDTPPRLRKG